MPTNNSICMKMFNKCFIDTIPTIKNVNSYSGYLEITLYSYTMITGSNKNSVSNFSHITVRCTKFKFMYIAIDTHIYETF